MLATAGPNGATQTSLGAHGFDASFVTGLVNLGLATNMYERVSAGGEMIDVTKARISEKERTELAVGG
jgi:hypothetical protein